MIIQAQCRGRGGQVGFQHGGQSLRAHIREQRARSGFGTGAVGARQGLHGQMHQTIQTHLSGQGRCRAGFGRERPDGQGHGKRQGGQGFGGFQAPAQIIYDQNQRGCGHGPGQVGQFPLPAGEIETVAQPPVEADFQHALIRPGQTRTQSVPPGGGQGGKVRSRRRMQLFQQRHGQAQRRAASCDPIPARARVRDARRQFFLAPPAGERQGLGQRPDDQRVQPGQCEPGFPLAHWRRRLTADGVDPGVRSGGAAPFRNVRHVEPIAQPERKNQGAQQPDQAAQPQAAGSTQPPAGPEGAGQGAAVSFFIVHAGLCRPAGLIPGCGDEDNAA